jgi:hypothetical protein
LLDKMDGLVFHNTLQRFQSVVARPSANSDILICMAKSIEQQWCTDGDLEPFLSRA